MNQELYFEPRCGGLFKLKNHLIVQVAPMELTILLTLIFYKQVAAMLLLCVGMLTVMEQEPLPVGHMIL